MVVSKVPRLGHAAKQIASPLFSLFVWDVIVTILFLKIAPAFRQIELPFSLFGTALALFIGFAVNASYARWWEARQLWGLMINASRNVARQALTLCDDSAEKAQHGLGRTIARAQIAYVNVLRTALRGEAPATEGARYLPPDKAQALDHMVNKPNAILTDIGQLSTQAHGLGMLDAFARIRIETTLVDIANAQGGMERIKNTPLPAQYRFFPSFFAKIFCVILPFAVVRDLGVFTPIGSALVSLMFLMAVQIGLDLMDPFANEIWDVPMTAMCRTVEIDLLQMMGETAPEKIQPEHGVLW